MVDGDDDDPDRLERHAGQYERLIRFVTDEQALHALREMAFRYRIRASEIRKDQRNSQGTGMSRAA